VSNPIRTDPGRSMPANDQPTPILPGLSPICGRAIEARFDGELMSSDGGLLVLREVEQRLGIAQRLATCIRDPRAPERIVHGLDEIIRFRMLMIAAGYEDGNDADSLRADPLFKLAMDRLPEHGDLCSQSTVSRAENLPGWLSNWLTRSLRQRGLPVVCAATEERLRQAAAQEAA
jgi:hypothetical protein